MATTVMGDKLMEKNYKRIDNTTWAPNQCVILYELPKELHYLAFVSAQIVNKIIFYKIMKK